MTSVSISREPLALKFCTTTTVLDAHQADRREVHHVYLFWKALEKQQAALQYQLRYISQSDIFWDSSKYILFNKPC